MTYFGELFYGMEHWLRVAIYEDPDRTGLEADEHRWIARSLTYAVFGESTTREGALHNLLAAILLEVEAALEEKRDPFEGLPISCGRLAPG